MSKANFLKKITFLLCVICISLKVNAEPVIKVEINGSATDPKKLFGVHYEKGYGFGVRAELDFTSDNFLGYGVSIPYNLDLIKIKDSNKRAQINTIGIGISSYLMAIQWGYDFLLGSFKIDKNIYNNFGGSTLTELKEKNGKLQIGIRRYIGLRLPIGEYFSMSYRLESNSLDYDFNFWHSASSGLLKQLTIQPFHILTYISFARTLRMELATILYFTGIAIATAWYYYDYKNHNYKWNDPKPLNYTRHSLTFDFPIYLTWH